MFNHVHIELFTGICVISMEFQGTVLTVGYLQVSSDEVRVSPTMA